MTRYDPFSFGQVRLDSNQPAKPEVLDEMLFADAGPVKQAPPAADTSWSLLDESVESLLPGAAPNAGAVEFGTDILGEVAPEAAARPSPPPAAATKARPAAAARPPEPRAAKTKTSGKPAPMPPSQPESALARKSATDLMAAAKSVTPPAPVRRPAPLLPVKRSSSTAALLVPVAIGGLGSTAASWFYLLPQNPMMAGIVLVTTLVGAALARICLRG